MIGTTPGHEESLAEALMRGGGATDTPRVPAVRPVMTGRGHAVRVTRRALQHAVRVALYCNANAKSHPSQNPSHGLADLGRVWPLAHVIYARVPFVQRHGRAATAVEDNSRKKKHTA